MSEEAPEGSDQFTSAVPGIVGDVVVEIASAIGAEILAASNDPTSTIELRNGRFVGTAGPLDLWTFEGDETFPALPETPASLTVPGAEPVEARVVAVDDRDYVIGVVDELPNDVPIARLSLEPWFIYDALRDRLADFDEQTADLALAESLLDIAELPAEESPSAIPPIQGQSLSAEQRGVAAQAKLPGLRFVWGPPGTGKTATLAGMVQSLVQDGKRVCILAHANAAVDVAMVRVAEMLSDHPVLAAGRVLRVGTPHLDEARNNRDINPDEIIRRRLPALVAERDALVVQRREVAKALRQSSTASERSDLSEALEAIRNGLSVVEKRLGEARNKLVDEAMVLGLTLSRAVINDMLWTWPADVVIVDEASMAGAPFVLALAMRGAGTLALFGDFRQLPPIAVSQTAEAQRWFARDVFELAGVSSRVEAGEADSRLSILRTQYRMGSDIAAVVGRFAYFDLLRTDPGADERAKPLADLEPSSGSQLVLVDTSAWDTACLTDASPNSYSRFNLLSAALSTTVARLLVDEGLTDVGVISAYRAHARLMGELCRSMPEVRSATTHRFQGAERDAIVLDLVDAMPQAGPSMLTGKDKDLSLRLLNVAVSRARGKIVVVADLGFIEQYHPLGSPARLLVELADQRGASRLDARHLAASAGAVTWFESWRDGVVELLDEPMTPSTILDLSLPSGAWGGDWLGDVTAQCAAAGASFVCRAPVEVAAALEGTTATIRLKPVADMPIAILSGTHQSTRILASGRSAASPAACMQAPGLERVVDRYLSG